MKAVVSWIATVNDYRNGQVNTDGPNYNLHRHFYKYQKHFLLTTKSPKSDVKTRSLIQSLHADTGHSIEHVYLALEDVTDIKEVYNATLEFLISKKDYELEVFISPGTPTMQVAWYLIKLNQSARITLFQIAEPKHSPTGKHEIRYVDVESNSVTTGLLFKEYHEKANQSTNYEEQQLIIEPNKEAFAFADKVALTNTTTVLITGETGTGKGVLARYIHYQSSRKNKPFVKVNCAGLSDELLASELFGHEKGAFTGAIKEREGLFAAANGGTIFLDEIGDISRKMQRTILEVLEDKTIMKVGSTKKKKIDVRIIAATNRSLRDDCEKEIFRSDLFYRLATVEIELLPIKSFTPNQKRNCLEYFINKKKIVFGKEIEIKDVNLEELLKYRFPGNYREMDNILERMYIYNSSEEHEKIISGLFAKGILPEYQCQLLENVKKNHIKYVMNQAGQNKRRASSLLGISLNTLKKYLDEGTEL